LYEEQAKRLNSRSSQFLRIPFAHAYARIAPTQSEAIYGWFTLGDWLVEYGYDQSLVDEKLLQWCSRLKNPFVIEVESDDPRIASLALRHGITKSLLKNSSVVLEKLMELARAGDGRAAERVLEQGDSKYAEEAIQLLFQFQGQVRGSLDYWQLYASKLDIENSNFNQAIERLTPISKGNSEYKVQANSLLELIESFELKILKEAFDTDSVIPTRLKESYKPNVMQDLFQQCIRLCHAEGPTQWNSSAIRVLLTNSKGVQPRMLAEANRLVGQYERAITLFEKAIKRDGPSVQTTAGLADCMDNNEAMQRVARSTSPDDASSYWYWLSNVRLLQWFIEEGGDKTVAIAKINRLRKKDASLGGAQFMSQLNTLAD
jgi:tetratricopeptide (TPR) repeat protein